ncbi:MAG TPA: hypothetical protein PLG77_00330 [Burkholderiaceae bacterium]|nr:hypothetical protein [Burkholderiaceae bacterium]HRP26862.1 hypothetical protein [Burkholderiaceae bacterium]
MTIRTTQLAIRTALAAAVSAALPFAAQAQTASDGWQWQAAMYGFFPELSGTTQFPSGAGGPNIDISSEKLIDSLKFAFMATLGAKKGQWGFWTDIFYTDVGGSKSGTRDFGIEGFPLPVDVNGNFSLDVKTTLWTLAGTYEIAKSPTYTIDLLAGTRLADMNQNLDWTINGDISGIPLPGHSGTRTLDLTNWDAIVGVKGMAYIGGTQKWFLPYYVDVGAGQSKLTWQFYAGLGYQFDWGALVAAWRYIEYQMKSGEPIQSLEFNGPMVGAVFRF